jgi:hypothetical protein
MTEERKYRGKVPLHNQYGPEAKYAVEAEALLPTTTVARARGDTESRLIGPGSSGRRASPGP